MSCELWVLSGESVLPRICRQLSLGLSLGSEVLSVCGVVGEGMVAWRKTVSKGAP